MEKPHTLQRSPQFILLWSVTTDWWCVYFLDFSFWVAANMPLDDSLRIQILSINCPTQRLRKELDIVRKVLVFTSVDLLLSVVPLSHRHIHFFLAFAIFYVLFPYQRFFSFLYFAYSPSVVIIFTSCGYQSLFICSVMLFFWVFFYHFTVHCIVLPQLWHEDRG